MNRPLICLAFLLAFASAACAQSEPVKFIANTLVVQADGTYESDPDLATLTFDVSSQDNALSRAYAKATQSMQQIVAVAQKNGLKKNEIVTGVLTLTPSYDLDHNKKPKSYSVNGEIVLKVHDFSKIGPILDDSVQNGLADFRSLEYSLENEEAAKQRAVADAMHNAVERAKAALMENGQKSGAIRYANVDISQISGIAQFDVAQLGALSESVEVKSSGGLFSHKRVAPPPPPPPVQPGKITVTATVQCAFHIE
ncbi:MAG TPA: SIMPL domain-containing protein [Candidatus Acidoferrales bacterium]|nr:SIMPL domain-containing protein [Candidatus Acidoferrales bacterium]